MSFQMFNSLCEKYETYKGCKMTIGEHNSVFVNFIRYKVGLPPLIEGNKNVRPIGRLNSHQHQNKKYDHGKILELKRSGKTHAEITKETGCSGTQLTRIMKIGSGFHPVAKDEK